MFQVEMTASVREAFGKGPMRRLRQQGITPAVVYGAGKAALPLQMDAKILMTQLLEFSRVNTVVSLSVDGQDAKNVVIAEIQSDPVTDALVHVDFCEIDLDQAREFTVPVTFEGTPKGVDLGGRLESHLTSVILKAKPLDIPNEFVINIADLAIDEQLTVADVALAENVVMVTPAARVMVAVLK
ncbi:50S ribosomal protein L25 [Desulfotalea psychrophila]|uniref:Large ribosomal subunit protein bL25 n=1 Tax=Desulfotalea psychrophila (strain LSv54 / DSM 12343) TaxID=177439 RepID=RL25_DESPS|nr:50S ribosomal protein L25 [Desulfotalea psychrophila]Q6AJL8.1 RecName: Full=Large ribosomal subunit protein bL25; AltName: Full=50S ribosomal protein L25; AltName: Full=General stress protein CTC [Desulfotalea psychrophila LSv54]CAG37462.1 related to 50S ribosomal protein L25 [Desulfotalea psychrophila LSv54]